MKIAVLKECAENESRVAVTPEIVQKYINLGININIEKGCGIKAGFNDEAYNNVGAKICESKKETIDDADVILKINAPTQDELLIFKQGQSVIASFQGLSNEHMVTHCTKKINCFALERIPRISRAQSMDVLSSQSNLAGYAAVIDAFANLSKAAPLLMTAAGTIYPARVLIMGAGVAGLQAIATAKRLGAIVYATDVRSVVKEQVESLGAKFVEVDVDENAETSGGYAKQVSEEYLQKQKNAISERLKQTDVLITTALVQGKPAPKLVDKEMLKLMPNGAVVVDMADASGGNVEKCEVEGINIIRDSNLVSKVAQSASKLWAQNVFNFVGLMYDKESENLTVNFDDEIISTTCFCYDGNFLSEEK